MTPEGMTKAELDSVWEFIAQGWEIEAREYFEARSVRMGFSHPLQMAVHHMWKRCVKDNPPFLREHK